MRLGTNSFGLDVFQVDAASCLRGPRKPSGLDCPTASSWHISTGLLNKLVLKRPRFPTLSASSLLPSQPGSGPLPALSLTPCLPPWGRAAPSSADSSQRPHLLRGRCRLAALSPVTWGWDSATARGRGPESQSADLVTQLIHRPHALP